MTVHLNNDYEKAPSSRRIVSRDPAALTSKPLGPGLRIAGATTWWLCLLLSAVPLSAQAQAAAISASSCAESDVQAAMSQAHDGDTVTIPAGTCTWTQVLIITNAITLQGSGCTLDGNGRPTACNTVITDGTSKGDSNCQGTSSLIAVAPSSDVFVRVTGFAINGLPAVYNCSESAEHIGVSGNTHQFRIDHMVLNVQVTGINTSGDVWGVIDHNTFNDAANKFGVGVHHGSWQGVGNWGDNSWAQPDTLGTAAAVFIEDNTFNFTNNVSFPVGCFDSEGGGRLVFRHNLGCPFVGMHGTESSIRLRSGRQYEVYDNVFTAANNSNSNMYTGVFLRGGTGMVFRNSFNDIPGIPYISLIQVNNYRDTGAYDPWGPGGAPGACDGTSPFDTNIGGVYDSGTYNGSGTTDILTDTTKSWTPNQWAGYSILNVKAGWSSAVGSNAGNTITSETLQQPTGPRVPHTWTNGDAYEIHKAYPCIDQIGRGAGGYISGWPAVPEGPVNQVSRPVYEWLNDHNGTVQAGISSNNPQHVAANRDYYDWTGSFTGASGVGSGTLAQRPATCTPAVAYWATDTNTLYQCGASNTWTAYYTPYTYPHPLARPPVVAATCSQADVQVALSSATDGDTVVIPAGTCTWTTPVYFNAPPNLTIQGQTICTGSGNPAQNNLACTDKTIIVDGIDRSGYDAGMLNITTASSGVFRITGITFSWGGGIATYGGTVRFAVTGSGQMRQDHIHYNQITSQSFVIYAVDTASGVTDHILVDVTQGGWKNYGVNQGHAAWAAPTGLGTSGSFFYEDNRFNNASNDCYSGGRWVIRYNTFSNNGTQTHPTGGDVGARGCRSWELYGNQFIDGAKNNFNVSFLSSGSGVVWGNSTPGNTFSNFVTLHSMRRNNHTYTQAATPARYGYCGTSFDGTGSNWDQNTNPSTGYRCLDQPGQGQSDLLSGDLPNIINTVTGCDASQPCAWPHQAHEPVYEWNDTFTSCPGCGGSFWAVYEPDALFQNSDYYLCNAQGTGTCTGFDGTSGVGSGLLSARPATCTPGVAYWSTDQGNWNQSGSGGQGVLDKCTAPNTWTNAWYVPYPYPHPLVSGAPPPPPPTGTNPGSGAFALNLPPVLPINASITATVPSGWTVSRFDWTFTSTGLSSATSSLRTPAASPNGSLSTPAASASLAPLHLTPGPYTITVSALNGTTPLGTASANTTLVLADLSAVKVYPNPWRSDKHAGGITFANLPVGTTIKLFTTSGHHVKTLSSDSGRITWDRTNDSGDKAASGIYLYLITTTDGQKLKGKVGIIK